MQRLLTRFVLAAAVTLAAAVPTLAQEPRIALVIGNADYPAEVGALDNTHQDARVIAAALQEVGFSLVTGAVVLDADKGDLEEAVYAFQQALVAAGPDGVGFLYYSGHGASHEVGGVRSNYFIPARTSLAGAQDLPLRGVSLSTVLGALASTGAKAVFVVSDACRNTLPWTENRGGAQPDRGFAPVATSAGLYVAHATAEGETAPDDGAFAAALAAHIVMPDLTADRAFTLAFRQVALTRTGYRRPTAQDALASDFCFVACPGAAFAVDPESQHWDFVLRMDSQAAYEVFLESYPGGAYADEARARLSQMAGGQDTADDDVEAVRRFRLACDDGEMTACVSLGFMFEKARGVAQDDAEAVRLYRLACDSGNMRGCGDLGVMRADGRGAAQDDAEALRLFRLACDGGNMRGCSSLGVMYRYGRSVAQDDAEAVRLYRLACDGGNAGGCSNLGFMHAEGRAVAQDDAEAVRLYRLACDAGDMRGCSSLGFMYGNGRGLAQDDAEAVRLYRLACDGGFMGGCNGAAWRLATSADSNLRDGGEAVRLAEIAIAADPGEPDYRGTLAAAYAEQGRFEDAVREQQAAIALIGNEDPEQLEEFEDRLALYQLRTPYRSK